MRAKAPRAPARLTAELVAFVQRLRKQDLFKSPGVAETLDWASALTELDAVVQLYIYLFSTWIIILLQDYVLIYNFFSRFHLKNAHQ